MEYEDLIQYIQNIYQLEVSLYNQNALINGTQQEIYMLNNYKDSPLFEEQKGKTKESFDAGCGCGVIIGIVVFIIYIAISIHNQMRNFYSLSNFLFSLAKVTGGAFLISFISITLWDICSEYIKVRQNNRMIREQNENINRTNIQNREYFQRKLNIYNNQLAIQEREYSDTERILDEYYNKDIVFPKYRNIVAISSFYEYLVSGRCTCLEGHEGAYNIYENELRQNTIIGKIDVVIQHLETIENNQYMLYSAIQESNRQVSRLTQEMQNTANLLQNIESNTAIAAYNSEIAAENTKLLAWIEMYEFF